MFLIRMCVKKITPLKERAEREVFVKYIIISI